MRQFERKSSREFDETSLPRTARPVQPGNVFEELLSTAARKIGRGTGMPAEAVAAIDKFFSLIGTSEAEMMALSAEEIRTNLREQMSGYVGKALGLLGKADVRNLTTHVHGMRMLAKAAELCPDDRRIQLELSNVGHSVQWDFLKRAVADDSGKEPGHDAVRRERIREEVEGLRATHRLLRILEMDSARPDLAGAKQFLVGIWSLSNAAHYYYTLGTLKAQGNKGVDDEFREFGRYGAKESWREAIRYSRAVMDYFGIPAEIDRYYEDLGTLVHHRRMEKSIPETVGGIFSISGLAYRDLGELRNAVVCLRVATELSPMSSIFAENYRALLRTARISPVDAEGMLLPGGVAPRPAPALPARKQEAGWDAIEAGLNLSDPARERDFVGIVWRHLQSTQRAAEIFVQHHRSEQVIATMWELASDPDGLRRVKNLHEILQKLELLPAVRGLGVPQALAQYDEIISAMSPS